MAQVGPAADGIGLRSVLSVRLARSDDDPIGSLNVFHTKTRAFDSTDIEIAQIIAQQASHALIISGKLSAMSRGLATRTTIGHAQGILMMRYDLEPEQSFDVLRRYSQHTSRPLRNAADQVVRERDLPPSSGAD